MPNVFSRQSRRAIAQALSDFARYTVPSAPDIAKGALRDAVEGAAGSTTVKTIPFRAGAKRGNVVLDGSTSLYDLFSRAAPQFIADRLVGGRDIAWGWKDAGFSRPKHVKNRDVRRAFDQVARIVEEEIKSSFPRKYYFSGLSRGHMRRYMRDLEKRLPGSGYAFEDDHYIVPKGSAYALWAARKASPLLNAGVAGGGLYAAHEMNERSRVNTAAQRQALLDAMADEP